MKPLTPKQRKIYEYLKECEYSPSVRDIMAAIGLKSSGGTMNMLNRMRDRGLITWQPGRANTIQIVGDK
jgi:repressor LexA